MSYVNLSRFSIEARLPVDCDGYALAVSSARMVFIAPVTTMDGSDLRNIMDFVGRMKGLKRDVPAIFLALKDRETPIAAKALAAVTVGYALSPIDLIPDFIPLLGYLDDVILLPAMVALTIKLIPSPVLERCRRDGESIWENGKPKKWYYALPIALVWVLVIVLICRALFGL